MHFNPCGRAVDWIQFPFEVDARVHRGEGAPLVRLRWMFTDQPFLPVGTGSIINNRIWNADQISMLEVGQLPTAEANFVQDARWELPAVLVPGHQCHPEWYATGEPWPTELPPTVYTPEWIPECCGIFIDPTEGGMELGGEVGDVFIPPCVTPTTTCAAATPGATNHTCTHSLPALVDQWRKWSPGAGESVQWQMSSLIANGFNYWVYDGSDCGALTLITSGFTFNDTIFHSWTTGGPHVWVKWQYVGPSSAGGISTRLDVF